MAEGIVQAVDRGAKVINLSLGGTGESKVLKNAVDYAQSNGALVVAAVGNEGVGEVSYPAKFDHVIGVTSVDANGRQSSFANYGEGVDILLLESECLRHGKMRDWFHLVALQLRRHL